MVRKKKVFRDYYEVKIVHKGYRCTLYIEKADEKLWEVSLFKDSEPFAPALVNRFYSRKKYTPSMLVGMYRDGELDLFLNGFGI